MENLSHSRQPNKPSKKMHGSVGFAPKYDDVFGGPPKFGVQTLSPRVEDYSEIFSSFHASRASSIPVLDLPVVDKAEVSFDARSSSFDYAEVFGGFDGLDFAVSYEELVFGESKGGDEFSSEEAWNPAGTGSLSEESDHSGKNQCSPHGDSYHLFDERTEFSISYHKATRSSEDFSNMMTHTAQLHDVPGFTCDVDRSTPLQKTEDENTFLQVTDDSNLNMDYSAEAMKGKHLRKTMSHPPNGSAGRQVENDVKSQSGYNKNGYFPNETFISISEISLRTQPSQLPPPSRPPPKKGDSSGLSSNCNANASEGTAGDISPPFFDVEVDATSPAAISAAAMKEAMVKAQAKLKSVKELMERKEGFQSRMRPGSRSGKKNKEEKLSEIVDGTDSLKNEGLPAVSDSLEGEKLLNAKKTADEKHGKESRSPQEFVEIGRADEWKEATQFFELVRTDKSRKDFEQANNEKYLVQNTKSHKRGQKEKKAAMEAFKPQEDYEKNLKAVAEDHVVEAYEKKLIVMKDNCEREENSGKLKASKGARKHKEHEKKVKVAQEACEREGNENKFKMVQQPVEIEKKLTGADDTAKHEKLVELQVEENQIEVEQAIKCKENARKVKEANRRIKNEKKLKESRQREEDEKKPKEILELAEDEKILKETLKQEDREKKLREVFERDKNEKKQNEAHKREENEKILKEALEKAENERRLKEALGQEENEKRLKEALEQEKSEKKRKEAHEREKTEKGLKEAHERKEKEKKAMEKEKKAKEALKKEDTEKSLKEACEIEDNSNIAKHVQVKDKSELRLKEARQREVENTSKEASKWEETEKPLKDTGEREELKGVKAERDQRLKFAQGASMHMEVEDVGKSNEACKVDDIKNLQATQLACEHEENSGKVEGTEEALAHDDRAMRNSGKESESVEIADVLVDERSEAPGMAQGDLEDEENKCRMEDATESILSHDSMKKVGIAGIGIGQIHVEQRKTTSRKDSDPKNRDRKCSQEWGDCDKNITQAEVAKKLEENKDKFTSTQVAKEWVENGRKTEAAQPAVLEGKRNAQKTAPQVNTNQSLERKEKNLNEILTSEAKEIERMKRERELEKERLRKIEEEREREREREKDRMAIDRATLEARESSYTEVRERAERAAMERAISEARQRAMTEARERLERACAEAREKSLIDKTIMEAKLRAERAAVERATAEARERAVEKAMAEKAAAEARERVERSRVRQSSSSSDQQDLQRHSAGPSSCARYPYSSVYGGATYYMERSEGVEGESPQRCKARLERHQRTAERAAKALAEKNMRDLLVQREQAERNRSAETLDADVRRWSSGKEGNLRALLSTLQYILGPDSGWQPVPLTEVITAAAVKKAYRKATLCVHPDKLQQRGASIQQKYICEKVFDLLKEAWNRFNSEER